MSVKREVASDMLHARNLTFQADPLNPETHLYSNPSYKETASFTSAANKRATEMRAGARAYGRTLRGSDEHSLEDEEGRGTAAYGRLHTDGSARGYSDRSPETLYANTL